MPREYNSTPFFSRVYFLHVPRQRPASMGRPAPTHRTDPDRSHHTTCRSARHQPRRVPRRTRKSCLTLSASRLSLAPASAACAGRRRVFWPTRLRDGVVGGSRVNHAKSGDLDASCAAASHLGTSASRRWVGVERWMDWAAVARQVAKFHTHTHGSTSLVDFTRHGHCFFSLTCGVFLEIGSGDDDASRVLTSSPLRKNKNVFDILDCV